MVEVKYRGRLGNKLFQYCLGRIIAEKLGYKLKADPIPGFPATYDNIEGKDFSNLEKETLGDDFRDLNLLLSNPRKRKIVLYGHFQRYEHYKNYKDKIKTKWAKPDYDHIHCHATNEDDMIVCVRRGDYARKKIALPYSYYQNILRKENYNNAYIVTEDIHDPFNLKLANEFDAKIVRSGIKTNFKIIMNAKNKIIISHSTFHWFPSFLSPAKEIFFPQPTTGFWSNAHENTHPNIDLVVDDEDRYTYVDC